MSVSRSLVIRSIVVVENVWMLLWMWTM